MGSYVTWHHGGGLEWSVEEWRGSTKIDAILDGISEVLWCCELLIYSWRLTTGPSPFTIEHPRSQSVDATHSFEVCRVSTIRARLCRYWKDENLHIQTSLRPAVAYSCHLMIGEWFYYPFTVSLGINTASK